MKLCYLNNKYLTKSSSRSLRSLGRLVLRVFLRMPSAFLRKRRSILAAA